MIKLLKNMRRKEVLMVLLCTVLVAVQVYFDLRLPDYMTDLTTLIKTSGATADILSVGVKMLGCTLASAVLAVGCGYLAAKAASGFSFTVREKLFSHVMDIGRGDAGFFRRQPHHENDERHHANSDDRGDGPADDDQIADHGRVGHHQNSRQELGTLRRDSGIRRGHLRDGDNGDEHLHPAFSHRAEADRPDQPCGARKPDGHQRGARLQRRAVPERQVQQAEP